MRILVVATQVVEVEDPGDAQELNEKIDRWAWEVQSVEAAGQDEEESE